MVSDKPVVPDHEDLPYVSLQRITRAFPGVLACDDVSLDLHRGEVHVLVGENGAGKSTLIAILSGLLVPDAGQLRVSGQPIDFHSPADAIAAGIGTVFQHPMLVPSLSVADNLLLSGRWWQRPRRRELQRRAQALADTAGLSLRLDAVVAHLSLAEQQQVEILRALLRDCRLLILDESTSMLSARGVDELRTLVRRLCASGLAVLFVTHKLHEAVSFGDRVSVLRQGRRVDQLTRDMFAQASTAAMSRMVTGMFGVPRQSGFAPADRAVPAVEATAGAAPVLRLERIRSRAESAAATVQEVNLTIGAGTVLGLAGIDSGAQSVLAEMIAGQSVIASGRLWLDGRDVTALGMTARRQRGLRYVSGDRLGEGTVGTLPVSTNLFLKQIGRPPLWRFGVEQRRQQERVARQRISEFDIRTPSPATAVGQLSGGNIQKVLLARELADDIRMVVFDKPTVGLDLVNAETIRQRIADTAAAGAAVLLISTELDELLQLCHRIAVMVDAAIVGEVDNRDGAPAARERAHAAIAHLMSGEAA